ncbi:hypothetical protein AMATHDRAFT_124666, partial [Amanita thiersii Skay4041]
IGCVAYVWIPEEKHQNKLLPKSELMIHLCIILTHLGLQPGIKGWSFLRSTGTIFIRTKAIFDKSFFPRCKDMLP